MATFNFTFEPGVTVQQALGFEMAGRIWSSYLSDPVTINIHVGVSGSLPTNVIGGSLTGILANASYGSVVNPGLQRDQKSSDDQLAYSRIFNTGDKVYLTYMVPVIGGTQGYWTSSNTINLTRANAKAIGAISGSDSALDGAIALGTLAGSSYSWSYDYTRSSSAPTGSLDFLSVALHELGHLLGFTSSVDMPGWNFSTINDYIIPLSVQQQLEQRTKFVTPIDLLRGSSSSANSNTNDLSYGNASGDKFFALDRSTRLGDFAMGKNKTVSGDGYQAGHWEEFATPQGIMDPALAPRERMSLSNLDLRAFDVIGWDLRNGLSASTLTTSFLTTIRDQSVQTLAQRLGQSTTWVNSNLATSPTTLVRDRTTDVNTMITNSQIYNAGTGGSGSGSTTPRGWIETYSQMATNQQVYVSFDTVSDTAASALVSMDGTKGSGSGGTIPRTWGEGALVSMDGTGGSGSGSTKPRPWLVTDPLLSNSVTAGVSTPLSIDSDDSLTHYQSTPLPRMINASNRSVKGSRFHSDEQPHRKRKGSNSLHSRKPKSDLTQANPGEGEFSGRYQQGKSRVLAQPTEGTPQRLELMPNSLGSSEIDQSSRTTPFWKYRDLADSTSMTGTSPDQPIFDRLRNFL